MATDLRGLMPGYDFLQTLMKNAGAALPGLPGMGNWITPTLDPAELDKRIQELKTVQFWLEQNARLLATTVQALEVQRMTLATLQTMNLPLTELRDALKVPVPTAPPPVAAGGDEAAAPAADAGPAADAAPVRPDAPAPARPPVDPLQWWGALTQQFTELAAKAVQDGAAEAAAAPAPRQPAAAKQRAAAPGATATPAARPRRSR